MTGKRILVVDDELLTCTMLQIALEGAGHDVFVSENGRKGVDNARMILPDIILSDVMMPEMDGYELCRTLKNNPKTHHIPIILLTSLDDSDSTIEGFESGADDYIVKPFSVPEVLVRIERTLRWVEPSSQTVAGISGNLAKTSLFELVNFCEEYRISGHVHVTCHDQARPVHLHARGKILLHLGEIIAIELTDEGGEFTPADDVVEALDAMLEWTEGQFVIEREALRLPIDDSVKSSDTVSDRRTTLPASADTIRQQSHIALLQFVFQQIRDELGDTDDLVAGIFMKDALIASDNGGEYLAGLGPLVSEYVTTSCGLCYMVQKGVLLNGIVTGTHGILALYRTRENMTLIISAPPEINTGLLHLIGRQAVEKIQKILA